MVEINYLIFQDERERITNALSVESFKTECNDIAGQFEVKFNSKVIGFVHKEIPCDGEFLITWIKLLNRVAKRISNNKICRLDIPEYPRAIYEFEQMNDVLKVRGIEVFIEKSMSNPPEELSWEELVGVEDFDKEVEFIEKSMSNPPEELSWEELIGVEDFKKEVNRITTKFKLDIQAMNPLLAEALLDDKYMV